MRIALVTGADKASDWQPRGGWRTNAAPTAGRFSTWRCSSRPIVLAKALADTPIKVTAVCPGFVQTDLTPANREQAPTTPEEAAEVVARAAALSHESATGTFVDATGR